MFIGSQFKLSQIRDGPLENLWGAGGRAGNDVQKKYIFAQGKIK